MARPATRLNGRPPSSLVQMGTMAMACTAPNRTTPSAPIAVPAIREVVSAWVLPIISSPGDRNIHHDSYTWVQERGIGLVGLYAMNVIASGSCQSRLQ